MKKNICIIVFITSEERVQVADETVCFYSTDDPYVPMEKAESFIKMINGNKIQCDNAGYFSKNEDTPISHTNIEEVWKVLKL